MKRLFLTLFGMCLFLGSRAVQVTFRVNMANQTISPLGVHVAGSFQSEIGLPADWNPAATTLTDSNADHVYELTVSVPMGGYQYKFLNGNTWPTAETNLTACGIGSDYNRVFVVGPSDTVLPVIYFNHCTPPGSYPTHWWNDAIFYEVFVRSFYDSNGDGKGDFAGLTAKLDYLNDGNPNTTTDLGITGIWLMPIMPSPSYHGYDVTDYKAIESDYGNMAGFDTFLAAAHSRGIKVIIDLVLNHTSSQHPWFIQSRSSTSGPYRDWYLWSGTNPGYLGPWGQSVWAQNNGSFNYALFYSGMPDLNWRKPEVKTAMWDAVQFWLGKGVDGYRLDAVKYLIEDSLQNASLVRFENTDGTFTLLKEFSNVVRAANPNAFTIGEAWSASSNVVPYVTENRLDACFEFDQALAVVNAVKTGSAAALRSQLNLVNEVYPKLQYGTFLSNHDQERVFSTLAGSVPKMKQAASLYLTLPGIPFLYYGEEVGMLGTGADEDKRKPMQWSAGANAGFTTGTPWRSVNANYASYNVASQEAADSSLLNHYKRLISIRNQNEALRKGYYLPVNASQANVLSYGRVHETLAILVVANLGSTSTQVSLSAAVSTLFPGTHYVTDLTTGETLANLPINDQGGFSNYLISDLKPNETKLLYIYHEAAVSTPISAMPLHIFPNPTTHFVQIETARPTHHGILTVYSLEGKVVTERSFTGTECVLDVSQWNKGHYFVQVKDDTGNSQPKHFVVSH